MDGGGSSAKDPGPNGGDSGSQDPGPKDGDNPSPIRSNNKVAIIGATLGGVLGAMILSVFVYTAIRYRRRRRSRLGSVGPDTGMDLCRPV